jgi:PleD family two-component response regulator
MGLNCGCPAGAHLTDLSIAECKESGNIMEAMNNADKALYHVKKSTKNDYVVWDELNSLK